MTDMLLKELLEDPTLLVPLSVDQYHQMIEMHILPEGASVELLVGFLCRKDRSARGNGPMTVGYLHAWALDQLSELLADIRPRGCYLRIQQPITLPPASEPEPDAAIVRGRPMDYQSGLPQGPNVLCVIEVADSSLQYDRTTKQHLYARAGIRQYLIINLVDRIIEEYREPDCATARYADRRDLGAGDSIAIETAGEPFQVPVASLLPPP